MLSISNRPKPSDSTLHEVEFDDYCFLVAESANESTDSDSDNERPVPLNDLDSDLEEDALPVFLWRPQTTESLGDWEVHTKVCILNTLVWSLQFSFPSWLHGCLL